MELQGWSCCCSPMPAQQAKQLSGSTAHLQKAKQVGRTKCCCSVIYFLVFPHFHLTKELAKDYDGYIYGWYTSLEKRDFFPFVQSLPAQLLVLPELSPGMDIWMPLEDSRTGYSQATSQDPSGQTAFLKLPFQTSFCRYCAGTMPWGNPGDHRDFEPQRHDDGYIEVIGFTMASLVSVYSRCYPSCRCSQTW